MPLSRQAPIPSTNVQIPEWRSSGRDGFVVCFNPIVSGIGSVCSSTWVAHHQLLFLLSEFFPTRQQIFLTQRKGLPSASTCRIGWPRTYGGNVEATRTPIIGIVSNVRARTMIQNGWNGGQQQFDCGPSGRYCCDDSGLRRPNEYPPFFIESGERIRCMQGFRSGLNIEPDI